MNHQRDEHRNDQKQKFGGRGIMTFNLFYEPNSKYCESCILNEFNSEGLYFEPKMKCHNKKQTK